MVTAVALSHNRRRRLSASSRRVLSLVFVGATTFLLAWRLKDRARRLVIIVNRPQEQPQQQQQTTLHINENAPPCTYQQLYESYGARESSDSTSDSSSSSSSDYSDHHCWRLSKRILRIPEQALLNRNTLKPLGRGNKGGVSKGIIALYDVQKKNGIVLGRQQQQQQQQCSVAYKTDLINTNMCQERWRHPFQWWGGTKSCIAAHLTPRQSSIYGEYLGSLPFYAASSSYAKAAVIPEFDDTAAAAAAAMTGILPTWGLVVTASETSSLTTSTSSYGPLRRHPKRATNQLDALGIIMPLQRRFQTLTSCADDLATSVARVARIMLPAARGLQYIHDLGLVHQDVAPRNIGVVIKTVVNDDDDQDDNDNDGNDDKLSSPETFIYDFGYMAYRKEERDGPKKKNSCTLLLDDEDACGFCQENIFPSPKFDNAQQKDANDFAWTVAFFLGFVPDNSDDGVAAASVIIDSLQKENKLSMPDIIRLLEKVATLDS